MNKTAVIDQPKVQNMQESKSNTNHISKWSLLWALVIVSSVGGVITGVARGSSLHFTEQEEIDDVCSNVSAGERVQASSSDYITLMFNEKPTKNDCKIFLNAAVKLSRAIGKTENTYNKKAEQDLKLEEVCGLTGESNIIMFNQGEIFQNLVISVVLQAVDGVEGTLGFAGPCILNKNNGVPLGGLMFFDTADTARLIELGRLGDVILHEMMHVLGFGTTWAPFKGIDGNFSSNYTVIEDKVFTYDEKGDLVIRPDNVPKYTGVEGIAEFEKLSGKTEKYVPIQGAKLYGNEVFFNVSAKDGLGSLDNHIDYDTFENALMTYGFDMYGGIESPLTALSLGMLRDIGYTVDTSVADEYIFPAKREKKTFSLRGDFMEIIDLSNDVLRIEPMVLDIDDPSSLEQLRSRKQYSLEEVFSLV
eukprot:snap_masked-scaffold_6-processed-gene-5.21-mRNA-1 protein AED:1.00 eAED:1.00 QI:0/0/0/0/1/1/2/0/417